MKKFSDWVEQKEDELGLSEAKLTLPDFEKHNYKYSKGILGRILSGQTISVSNSSGGKEYMDVVITDKNTLKLFQKLLDNIESASVTKFDEICTMWCASSEGKMFADKFEEILGQEVTQPFLKWVRIDKSVLTTLRLNNKKVIYGNNTELTKLQEGLQAYAIELSDKEKNLKKVIERIKKDLEGPNNTTVPIIRMKHGKVLKVDSKIPYKEYTEHYINRCCVNAAKAWAEIKTKYGVKGDVDASLPEIDNSIAGFMQLHSKRIAGNIDKDAWNPADIYVSVWSTQKFVTELTNVMEGLSGPELRTAVNDFLKERIMKHEVFPISLKMPESDTNIVPHIDYPVLEKKQDQDILVKSCSYQSGSHKSGLGINMYSVLKMPDGSYEQYKFQFKKGSTTQAIIELGNTLDKAEETSLLVDIEVSQITNRNKSGARVGKAKTAFCACIAGLDPVEQDTKKLIAVLKTNASKALTPWLKKIVTELLTDKPLLTCYINPKTKKEDIVQKNILNLFLQYINLILTNTKTKQEQNDLIVYMVKAAKKENYKKMNGFAPFIKIS